MGGLFIGFVAKSNWTVVFVFARIARLLLLAKKYQNLYIVCHIDTKYLHVPAKDDGAEEPGKRQAHRHVEQI